jgi:hypothetical protein
MAAPKMKGQQPKFNQNPHLSVHIVTIVAPANAIRLNQLASITGCTVHKLARMTRSTGAVVWALEVNCLYSSSANKLGFGHRAVNVLHIG